MSPGRAGRSPRAAALVFLIFIAISLLTNILGPIIPDVIQGFSLSLSAAALLPFSFFIAYGVMSIPAGFLVERHGEKSVIVGAFALSLAGSLLIAITPGYYTALFSVFLIGVAMAVLQVAINPLLRVAGGEEHFAFNCALAQLLFGGASFLSPQVYSYLVTALATQGPKPRALALLAAVTPARWPWISLYWLFSVLSLVMLILVALFRFPVVRRNEEEIVGSWQRHRALFGNRIVLLYFVSVSAYVGSEQGTANWLSQFLSTYHQVDPHKKGAMEVAWFWGLVTIGCAVGLGLLKLLDSRKVLIGASVGALAALTAALFGDTEIALLAFPAIGFFASVMWPIIMSLALNSLRHSHGAFAGILCTAIIGGAIVPLWIGQIGDHFGLRAGLLLLYLTFGWVLTVGFWARPLVRNQTILNHSSEIQPNG
jgi:MFS transporter, FHS family, L-fucose permease